MRRRSRNGDRRRYWGKVERSDFRGFGSISRFTVAIEDNAVLFYVDMCIVEPASMHALSENIAAFTTKGAAAASKETEKIALCATTDWTNVVPFVLESTRTYWRRPQRRSDTYAHGSSRSSHFSWQGLKEG